jgi:2-C-methyl-D-erythritol 4-phosphate cytidylyltransferase
MITMVAGGQTNIINIYNSRVTINNITPVARTNVVVKDTNRVVLSQEVLERLQWEQMLNERRRAAFKSFLRKCY